MSCTNPAHDSRFSEGSSPPVSRGALGYFSLSALNQDLVSLISIQSTCVPILCGWLFDVFSVLVSACIMPSLKEWSLSWAAKVLIPALSLPSSRILGRLLNCLGTLQMVKHV